MFSERLFISPLTAVAILIAVFFHVADRLLFLYLFGFIHEMGHVLVARFFSCRLKKIGFHIYGFSADLENVEYHPFYQQFLIYIAGPATCVFSGAILFFLRREEILNLYTYKVYGGDNIALALFNLLPLYPLDGGRITELCYRKYLPVKKAFFYRNLWTFVSFIPLLFSLALRKQYIFMILIASLVLMSFFNARKAYVLYLQNRLWKKRSFPPKWNSDHEVYHFYDNFYFSCGNIRDEAQMIPEMILREGKKSRKKGKKLLSQN